MKKSELNFYLTSFLQIFCPHNDLCKFGWVHFTDVVDLSKHCEEEHGMAGVKPGFFSKAVKEIVSIDY